MNDILNIRDEFGKFTGLRHCSISQKSGEEFYHSLLNSRFKDCVENNRILIVDLDGNRGYSPSFIDESFGNLVYDFRLAIVQKYLKVKTDNFTFWEESILKNTYPNWEEKRLRNEKPVKTEIHAPWWRFDGAKFEMSVWIYPSKDAI